MLERERRSNCEPGELRILCVKAYALPPFLLWIYLRKSFVLVVVLIGLVGDFDCDRILKFSIFRISAMRFLTTRRYSRTLISSSISYGMPSWLSRCYANLPVVSICGKYLSPPKSYYFLWCISGRIRRQTPWSRLGLSVPHPIVPKVLRISLQSLISRLLPRRVELPIIAPPMPGPKPATRLFSRLIAFSYGSLWRAFNWRPPGRAAQVTFL